MSEPEYATLASLTQCPACAGYLASEPFLIEAFASVGIEHGKSSYQMALEYVPYLHRKHLDAVKGHALYDEGQPHDDDGRPLRYWGPGRGKCRCGAMSDVLTSDYKRRQWHRDVHKAELIDDALGRRAT